ncbi:unnamed protein product [Cylindrotheca closterium]|uniref:Leucine carboxyl methyltransferase 1 n=1 Tax=Cylindrotheca closterium TaxID=2856 RepID=A0AAD2PXZ5_9STRA|nr:unnamed protein product [Cylindrotheca closterium]
MLSPTDQRIIATADDAIRTKHAAVHAGYYADDYIDTFFQSCAPSQRQVQPIIKRGTHARVACVDRAISSFLAGHQTASKLQIVVVGAGKDTSYFRFRDGSLMGTESNNASRECDWYDVDHSLVIEEKARIIGDSETLAPQYPLKATSHGFTCTTNDQNYTLIGHDIREDPSVLIKKLNLDASVPTLFLTECVLMYVPDPDSKNLLSALSTAVKNASVVCYEPILGSDAFGKMMQQNLLQVGVATQDSCLVRTKTLQSQIEKLVEAGFAKASGCNMWSAYQSVVTAEQRQRANRCEFLDEMEEWVLIMQHYCFLVGTTDDKDTESSLLSLIPKPPQGFSMNK